MNEDAPDSTAEPRRESRAVGARRRIMRETLASTGVGRAAVLGIVILALALGIGISAALSADDPEPAEIAADVPEQVWFCPYLPNGDNVSSRIAVVNADDATLAAEIQYHVEGDPVPAVDLEVPANGRATFATRDSAPKGGAATVTLPPATVAVGATVARPERSGKASGAATYPCSPTTSPDWLFSIGNTSRGNAQLMHLYNPGDQPAVIDITYVTDGGKEDKVLNIAPRKPVTLDLGSGEDVLGRRDSVASIIRAEAGRVVAAQTLLPDGGTHGFGMSLGAQAGATNWYLPFIRVGGDTSVATNVLNTSDVISTVTAQFTPSPDGEAIAPTELEVNPEVSAALDVGPIADKGTYGLEVITDQNGVAELVRSTDDVVQSMIGSPVTARRWLIPWSADGVGSGRVFVQNPFGEDVSVELFVLPGGGADALTPIGEAQTIGPLARASLDVGTLNPPEGNAGLLVNASGPVSVAHSMSLNGDQTLSPAIPIP